MLFLRSFINLFMVPVVALVLFAKRENRELNPTLETLLRYCIIVAGNIPITRVITFLVRILTNMDIEADSGYYTVAALLAAVIMPVVCKMWSEFWNNLSKEDKVNYQTDYKILDKNTEK